MSIKNTIVLVVLIFSLLGFPTKDEAVELEIINLPYTMQADYFSNFFGVDSRIVNKVLECESSYDHTAKGDGNRSKGIAQFQEPTWKWMEAKYYKEYGEHLDYKSSHDQIKLTAYAISKGWGNNWTSYVAIKKGGTYSFYSNQLKKHFTVYCKL